MKVEFKNEKIIVYLYNYDIDINNIDEINDWIKKLFIKLIKRYKLDFYGYNIVSVYHNKKYGLVLETTKLYQIYHSSVIDLKIIIYKDVEMYLEFDDYYFLNQPKHLFMKNNKYYLNINNIKNISKYIEYGKLIIKKN